MMKSAIFTISMISLIVSQVMASCAPRNSRCTRRVRQGYGFSTVQIGCKPDRKINDNIYACAGPLTTGLTGTGGNNLCGAGFEVCPSATRCEGLGLTRATCNGLGPAGSFWATRESSAGNLRCNSNGGAGNNDIFGCSTCAARHGILYKNVNCKALTNALGNLRHGRVTTWNGWSQAPGGSGYNEKQTIRHDGTSGGVLCCRRPTPRPAPQPAPRPPAQNYYAAAKAQDQEEEVDEELYDEDEQVDDEESVIYDQQPFDDYNYKPLAPQTNQLQDATNLMMLAAALAILVLAVSATTYICVSTCKSNKNMAMYQPTKTDDMYD